MAACLNESEFALLSRTALFQSLTPDQLRRALSSPACTCAGYEKGEVIYAPDAFTRSLGVLLKGEVEVSKQELMVSVLGPGDIFGAAALFNEDEDYVTTLTARAPCRVVFFPQELMARLMREYSELGMAYVRYLSGRIRFLNQKIETLITGTAEERLIQYLSGLPGGLLDCPASQLARRLNISRASLYRAFETLEQAGVIRREGKRIYLEGKKGKELML